MVDRTMHESSMPLIRPRKKLYRTRAHSNVLNANDFWFPAHPGDVPISEYYPRGTGTRMPSFIDIGCGYGSLLLDLSAHFENTHVLGIEIRPKPVEYIQRKVLAIRCEAPIDLSESRHIGGGRDNGRANTEADRATSALPGSGSFAAARLDPRKRRERKRGREKREKERERGVFLGGSTTNEPAQHHTNHREERADTRKKEREHAPAPGRPNQPGRTRAARQTEAHGRAAPTRARGPEERHHHEPSTTPHKPQRRAAHRSGYI